MHDYFGTLQAVSQQIRTDPLLPWGNLDPLARFLLLVFTNLDPETIQ